MKVVWVGNKRAMANNKHFGGKLSNAQMDQLILKVIKNATHVGQSDRSNPGHVPAKIIFGEYAGIKFGMIIDGLKVKKNVVEIVSFYDITPSSYEHKLERFNMKEVKK